MKRFTDANRAAEKCVERIDPDIELLAQLGDLFASYAREKPARRFYEQCFQLIKTSDERRLYYVRFARWLKGASRWRLLLLAAQEMPRGSYRRKSQVFRVIWEMRTGDDALTAGRLAKKISDREIRRWLLIRQVELTADPNRAADLCLKLFGTAQIPKRRLSWVIKILSAGERNREIVRILESFLRRGGRLTRSERTALLLAYNKLDRPLDAVRAATDRFDRQSRTEHHSLWEMPGGRGLGFFSVGNEQQEPFQGVSKPDSP